MNNKVLLGVVGLVIVGAVVYFATAKKPNDSDSNNNTTNNQTNSNTENETDTDTTGTERGSLRNLLAQGAQTCTYNDGDTSGGTLYVANGKMRMDVSATVNGVATNSHGVIDGSTYYGWIDGQPSGFKMSVNDNSTTGNASVRQGVDVNKEVEYDCDGWTVDASKFVVPTNIQFTDLDSLKIPTGM